MQVSGVTFSFDPSKPPGSRVVPGSVRVGGEPLDASKQYKVAMKEYIQQGKVRLVCHNTCGRAACHGISYRCLTHACSGCLPGTSGRL